MPAISMISGNFGYGRPQRVTASSGDKIVDSLTTSLTTYNAASNGQWVKITQTEYDTMSSNVTGTTKASANDSVFNLATSGTFFSSGSNIIGLNATGANCPAIPASNYMYGLKIRTANAVSNVKVFTNNNTVTQPSSFTQVGSILPTTTASSAVNYYVLKGVNSINATTAGTVALHIDGSPNMLGWGQNAGGYGVRYLYFPISGCNVNINTIVNANLNLGTTSLAIQCLTTATKQWT